MQVFHYHNAIIDIGHIEFKASCAGTLCDRVETDKTECLLYIDGRKSSYYLTLTLTLTKGAHMMMCKGILYGRNTEESGGWAGQTDNRKLYDSTVGKPTELRLSNERLFQTHLCFAFCSNKTQYILY